MTATLAVRLDSDGDVLITGPALRALARTGDRLDLLVSPAGAAAGRLLPDVDEVLVFAAPWTGFDPPPVDPAAVTDLVERLRGRHYDRAVIFTSFHQSPLPMALLLRLAGVGWIGADSIDYPGSLLDLRHQRDPEDDRHEVLVALNLACAAGGACWPPDRLLPFDELGAQAGTVGDTSRLAVRRPLPDVSPLVEPVASGGRYVVVHPGASVPARAPRPADAAAIVSALRRAGWPVVVTGGPAETALTDSVAGGSAAGGGYCDDRTVLDLGGRTDLAQLAAVLDGAACVVVGNTGPAHLAAAVGTPVVSLFAPVVPAARWAPWGVPTIVLGDLDAPCRDTRARQCPVAGHPCLSSIDPAEVVAAVGVLAGQPDATGERPGSDPDPDPDPDPDLDPDLATAGPGVRR